MKILRGRFILSLCDETTVVLNEGEKAILPTSHSRLTCDHHEPHACDQAVFIVGETGTGNFTLFQEILTCDTLFEVSIF